VGYLIEQLQSNAPGDKATTERRRKFLIKVIQAEQKSIEQLQKEVETISKIDHAIDDALTKLMNQINVCRKYEQEGWQYLRSISRELSDKAARDHYYAMDTLWKNVKNIQQYVEGEFSAHFDQLVSEAQRLVDDLNKTIAHLKEKGIELKKVVQNTLEQEATDQEAVDVDEEDGEDAEPTGWFSWFGDILLWPFNAIIELWHYFFG